MSEKLQVSNLKGDELINEDIELNEMRGSYRPSFMQIKLTYLFGDGFKTWDSKKLGTFLHEYIHYLQNVSTPWGLYVSMVEYQKLAETIKSIQEEDPSVEIRLPIKVSNPELDRKNAIVELGCGSYPFTENYIHRCNAIDKTKQIWLHRSLVQIGSAYFPKITMDVSFKDGETRNIILGLHIIMESMAAMYQMMIDPTATHENLDLPYNLIQILCDQRYPNIANDRRKLISICYISLFSMKPAEVLINQLEFASDNLSITGIELFSKFVQESTVIDNNADVFSVDKFMDTIVDKFKTVLASVLDIELDYTEYVLDKVRISQGHVPLLSVIHNEELTTESFEELVNFLGTPFVYNDKDGQNYVPKSIKDPANESKDVLALIQYWALYGYLINMYNNCCCPLKFFCLKSVPVIEKEECFDFPWEGQECPITTLTNTLGFRGKKFKWDYSN